MGERQPDLETFREFMETVNRTRREDANPEELPAPLHPTIDRDTPVNIATIDATSAINPVSRPLDCQLGLLYEALMEHAGTDSVTMGLTVHYEYSLGASLPKVRLPVFMQAPMAVAITEVGTGLPLANLVAQESQLILDWFAQYLPSTTSGTLLFDLTVMSNLTAQPMPILHLRRLYLDLVNIEPSPAASR